jgi:hypothetical protein
MHQAANAETVKVPPPDRGHFGVAYMSLKADGAESRTGAGIDLNVAWSPAIHITGTEPGLAFWDSMYIGIAMGKVLSTLAMNESGFALNTSTGYQLLGGWRTETFAAMGGLGIEFGLTAVGDPSIFGLSFPLVGHGELNLGDKRLAGTATAAFIGGRKQYGLDAMIKLYGRWGVGASFAYVSGTDEIGGSLGATTTNTSGFVSSLTVEIDRL